MQWNHNSDTIFGKPVHISEFMPSAAPGSLPVAFGDFSHYWIVNRLPLSAYTEFVEKLCGMAKRMKRVSGKPTETDNDKYAFRCFLLRLGFIGDEYKAARKILLKNLSATTGS